MTISRSPKLPLIQLALGLLLGLSASLALGDTIRCGSTPIRLAFYDFGLFHFVDNKGTPQGIDKEIVDALRQRSGCKFETQVMVRARIWADLASGALDMSVSGIQTAERDQFAWFAHYLAMKNFAVVQTATAKTVHAADDFLAQPGLKFGVVRSFKHGAEQDQWLDKMRAKNLVEESADAETIFRKLKDSRIQAVFSQPPVYRKLVQDLDMQGMVEVQDWTPNEKAVPHGLILSKRRFSEADATQWRALIDDMRSDGTLKAIFNRYLPAAEAARLLPL